MSINLIFKYVILLSYKIKQIYSVVMIVTPVAKANNSVTVQLSERFNFDYNIMLK